MKYTASRLSDGNKLFPDEISIDDNSVTIKSPKLFGGVSKSFPLGQISISIDSPMVGYSDITLFSQGTKMNIHGFTSSDAKKIKFLIENGSANQRDESERQNRLKRKEEDVVWMTELKLKNRQNLNANESGVSSVDNHCWNSDHGGENNEDDHSLNLRMFKELLSRMIRQGEIENRELTELEKISLESIKITLEGGGGRRNEEYQSSSKAHFRAFCNGIEDNLSTEEHLTAADELKKIEEYWSLGPFDRAQREIKAQREILAAKPEPVPDTQLEDLLEDSGDIRRMTEEIQNRLELATGEKFVFLPEFEQFTQRDEPMQTGYLLTNDTLHSIRLNFMETGKIYSVTYWNPDQKELQFTNYLGHLSFENAIRSIVSYYKNPSAKYLLEYNEREYEIGDPRVIFDHLDAQIKKVTEGDSTSLIITGETERIQRRSEVKALINNDNIVHIIGELTGFELYVTLHEQNGKVFLLTDFDISLRDAAFVEVLREATVVSQNRFITRPAFAGLSATVNDVPSKFEFTGKIIAVSSIPKKKLISLTGQLSTMMEIFTNRQDTISWLGNLVTVIELPAGRVKDPIRRKAMNLLIKASTETETLEISLRSLKKAIFIVNKIGYEKDEICYGLIKQHCS